MLVEADAEDTGLDPLSDRVQTGKVVGEGAVDLGEAMADLMDSE